MEKIKKTEVMERLGPGETHLHLLRISGLLSEKALNHLLPLLPREDGLRFQGLELESARLEFLWSRLLVRRLLSFYTGREMGDLTFGVQKWGKPFLEDSPLQFNLSHSQNLLALSVGPCPLGLDVERIDFSPGAGQRSRLLAGRLFSREEWNYWQAASGLEQSQIFFRIFTMKEAHVKALGRGLSLSLKDRRVPFTLRGKGQWGNWEWFSTEGAAKDYCLSQVCWNPTKKPRRHVIYDWNEETFEKFFRNSDSPSSFILNAVA